MIKTTQKALKKHVAVGIAKDITRYSFEEADALYRAHSLEIIAISSGVYGLNGALLKDEKRILLSDVWKRLFSCF